MPKRKTDNETFVRFRCPDDLKKALAHIAVDEGTTEGAVCIRLLTAAVERERPHAVAGEHGAKQVTTAPSTTGATAVHENPTTEKRRKAS
jgi:hypothetical protein